MSTPSAKRALPQIAGTDTPDVPRDINALITALEAEVGYPSARDIYDTGVPLHTCMGRVLTLQDFTDLNLIAPVGLWLATAVNPHTDQSGNARDLTNQGAVVFGTGIDGASASAPIFAGSTAQALYRADTGSTDQVRLPNGGTIACWFKTAKTGFLQYLISKVHASGANTSYALAINSSNYLTGILSYNGTATSTFVSQNRVTDDCWHFGALVFDGAMARLYLDGSLERTGTMPSPIFQGNAPFNLGSNQADASTISANILRGRMDEAFITQEALSEDQLRLLMCIKSAHGAPRTPKRVNLMVKRGRIGGRLVTGDFPATPLRLYNLSDTPGIGGTYTQDLGSNAAVLTGNGAASTTVPGPDGERQSALHLEGTASYGSATDTGLPGGTVARTFGCWFRAAAINPGAIMTIIGYGSTSAGSNIRIYMKTDGNVAASDGTTEFVTTTLFTLNDGRWHHIALVIDPSAADGLLSKLYVDGRCVASSTTQNASTTLSGATGFRIGRTTEATGLFFQGDISRAFVASTAYTREQIAKVYFKRNQDMGLSPKSAGDHVERVDATNIHFFGRELSPADQIVLDVTA